MLSCFAHLSVPGRLSHACNRPASHLQALEERSLQLRHEWLEPRAGLVYQQAQRAKDGRLDGGRETIANDANQRPRDLRRMTHKSAAGRYGAAAGPRGVGGGQPYSSASCKADMALQ